VQQSIDAGMDDEAVVARLHTVMLDEVSRADGPEQAGRLEIIMSTRLSALGLIRYVRRQAGSPA
jgi:hypothetical protein